MAEADDIATLQKYITTQQQAGYANQDIQQHILADPKWANLYTSGKMPILVPHTWGQEAQMAAEQFAQGVPSVVGLPGTLANLPHQLMGFPEGPSWLPTAGGVANWVGQQERNLLGVEPIQPLSPRERLGAAAAQGIGAGVVPLGGPLGIGARALSGGVGGVAGEATREMFPDSPVLPLIAGTIAGGVVGPAGLRAQQEAGFGPRTFSQIQSDYGVVPKSVKSPGLRDDISTDLKNQLLQDTTSMTGPIGAGGVRNTDLRQGKVDWFTNLPDDQALFAIQKDPDLAMDFRDSPTRNQLLRRAGGVILSRFDKVHIPNMDEAGTLGPVFNIKPEDAQIIRNQYGQPGRSALDESRLLRAVLSERGLALGGATAGAAAGIMGHSPELAAALSVTLGALPYVPRAADWLGRNFPGAMTGSVTGARAVAPMADPRRSWLGMEPYLGAPGPY